MAAPSKRERNIRENIKNLGLFVRDNNIYTTFEKSTNGLSKYDISYSFCHACYIRSLTNSRVKNLSHNIEMLHMFEMTKYILKQDKEKYEKLFELNPEAYYRLLNNTLSVIYTNTTKNDLDYNLDYSVYNILPKDDMEKIFGIERSKEFLHHIEIPFHSIDDSAFNLSKDEIHTLKKYNPSFITLIKNNTVFPPSHVKNKNRTTFLELDFTKPLDELIETVTKVKQNFDHNPHSIRNLHDILNDSTPIFHCDKDLELYISDRRKPFGGQLADVLFIYDCRKAGLNNEYIIDEINRYWISLQKLFKDKFQEKTLQRYYNLAIDYIDNKKYECYLSGYDK